MEIAVKVDGIRESTAVIRLVEGRASDMRLAFRDVAQWFRSRERQRFQTAGDGRWRPLTLRTVRRRGGDARLMNRTGRLYRSLASTGPGAIHDIRADRMDVGTSVPYAKYHQYRRGGRRVIHIRPADRTRIRKLVTDYLLSD